MLALFEKYVSFFLSFFLITAAIFSLWNIFNKAFSSPFQLLVQFFYFLPISLCTILYFLLFVEGANFYFLLSLPLLASMSICLLTSLLHIYMSMYLYHLNFYIFVYCTHLLFLSSLWKYFYSTVYMSVDWNDRFLNYPSLCLLISISILFLTKLFLL
jgi:hypothetical protein